MSIVINCHIPVVCESGSQKTQELIEYLPAIIDADAGQLEYVHTSRQPIISSRKGAPAITVLIGNSLVRLEIDPQDPRQISEAGLQALLSSHWGLVVAALREGDDAAVRQLLAHNSLSQKAFENALLERIACCPPAALPGYATLNPELEALARARAMRDQLQTTPVDAARRRPALID